MAQAQLEGMIVVAMLVSKAGLDIETELQSRS